MGSGVDGHAGPNLHPHCLSTAVAGQAGKPAEIRTSSRIAWAQAEIRGRHPEMSDLIAGVEPGLPFTVFWTATSEDGNSPTPDQTVSKHPWVSPA